MRPQDLTPLLLTADHCNSLTGSDWATAAASMVFYWNYENSTCRIPGSVESGSAGDGSLSQSQTGANFRAANGASDFSLVELDDDPDASFNVYWSGWDRSGSDATPTIIIHHPLGNEKRISSEDDPTTVTSVWEPSLPGDGTHFRIADLDRGTTEGGSSARPGSTRIIESSANITE